MVRRTSNQLQDAFANFFHVLLVQSDGVFGFGVELLGDGFLRRVEPGAPSQGVDGLEAPGRNEPRPGIGGNAILRPSFKRRGEGVVQRIFGKIEAAEQTNQCGKNPARLRAVNRLPALAYLFVGTLFRALVVFPESEHVVLGVLAEDEVAHLRHGCFGHADLAPKFLNFRSGFVHRRHAHVIGNAMFGVLALQHSAIGRVVTTASVDVPVRLWPREFFDFPAEQFSVE
jgi:hypothetical protein